jgi:hypothetical protein
MNQVVGTLVVIAGLVGFCLVQSGKIVLPSNLPVINQTIPKECFGHLQADTATIYRSAAKRIRSGEITNQSDLKAFFDFGVGAARQRSDAPMGKELGDAVGKTWDANKAAAACDKIANELN